MNFLFFILHGFTWINVVLSQRCPKIVTRREIRDLSNAERTRFFNAVKKLHYTNGNTYEGYTIWHLDNVPDAHSKPAFLPWHRQFIYNYEKSLQAIDSSIVLPYWDWSRDYEFPERSEIFSESYFGGNGRKSDNCVINGAFANWGLVTPKPHCLKRDFKNGATIPQLSKPSRIEAIIRTSQSYAAFRSLLEHPSHDLVHNNIGGRYGDFSKMHSPNDPIFYLHHAFVDMIWSEWQTRHPHLAYTYNGGSAKLTDIMKPFNVQVQSTLRTTDLCYRYPRFSANVPRVKHDTRPLSDTPSSDDNKPQESPVEFNNSTGSSIFSGMETFIQQLNLVPRPMFSPVQGESKTPEKIQSRKPEPISEEFIRDNHLNREEIRENERLMARLDEAIENASHF